MSGGRTEDGSPSPIIPPWGLWLDLPLVRKLLQHEPLAPIQLGLPAPVPLARPRHNGLRCGAIGLGGIQGGPATQLVTLG